MARHRNQSINAIKSNAPLGHIRGLESVKPDPDDGDAEPITLARVKAIPAWARRILRFGRPSSSEPSAILNPASTNPITVPVHTRIWICPEGEARGHFEIFWDQHRCELVIRTHPGVIAIKPHCANRASIVAVNP